MMRLPQEATSRTVGPRGGTAKEVIYGFVVDTTKCIGCGSCVRACKAENNVPDGYNRTWVEQYTFFPNGEVIVNSPNGGENGFEDDLPERNMPEEIGQLPVRGFFVPKLCNHCIDTPCIQVCPVGASYKTAEGVVLVDPQRCVGCGYCVQACPFGSRFLNPETNTADKCTWCYHRITKGLKPACVEYCPAKARIFGNVNDPYSEISQILATNRVQVLKSYLGTRPRTRYIGLDSEVI
ncbi:MAG: 4Fe-4S dicluster domain-containing protein [Gemmatimonadetes bacterium]|nr:4Fe-4S dicluster domain-containing protein [Gemmatimonadota bacterium]